MVKKGTNVRKKDTRCLVEAIVKAYLPPGSEEHITIQPPHETKLLTSSANEKLDFEVEDWCDPALSYARYLTENPSKFVELIKNEPALILNDYVIKLVISLLQFDIIYKPIKVARRAKKTLREAGIPVFIPQNVTKKKPTEEAFVFWRTIPGSLDEEVEKCLADIKKFYKPPYNRLQEEKKRADIAAAFQHIFQESMPRTLISVKNDKHITSIALAFISYKHQVTFEALKKFYYKKGRIRGIKDI